MVIRSLPATVDILYYENFLSEKLLLINCSMILEKYLDTCPNNDVISFCQICFCALGLGLELGLGLAKMRLNTFSVKICSGKCPRYLWKILVGKQLNFLHSYKSKGVAEGRMLPCTAKN